MACIQYQGLGSELDRPRAITRLSRSGDADLLWIQGDFPAYGRRRRAIRAVSGSLMALDEVEEILKRLKRKPSLNIDRGSR